MDKAKEIAKLLRRLADLIEDVEPIEQTYEGVREFGRVAAAALEESKPKWVNFVLQLAAPIGKPKAERIMARVAPSPLARRQIQVQMGPGSKGTKTFVVAFKLRCTDNHGDAEETAKALAAKIDQRGSDKRARAKVSRVLAVA